MIPKLIHHLWIDPLNPSATQLTIPTDVQENLLSWRRIETAYHQKIWLLGEISALCQTKSLPDVAQAIHSCRFPAMQADIARLLFLYIFGGFWVDLKLHLSHRFLDRFADHDLVLTEHPPKEDLPDPKGRLANTFLGAAPGNLVIAEALKYVTDNVNRRMEGSIYHITGATNLEIALHKTQDRGVYFMLPHQTAWGYLFEVRPGSYNGNKANMHWSLRERRESPYRD